MTGAARSASPNGSAPGCVETTDVGLAAVLGETGICVSETAIKTTAVTASQLMLSRCARFMVVAVCRAWVQEIGCRSYCVWRGLIHPT